MKKQKLIDIILQNICHDKYAYDPNWKWEWLPVSIKENYSKIRPVLLDWQSKGYIKLVEDEEHIFLVYPEKLPTKEELLNSIS